MKRDFLKELGLSDEVIDKVMAEHGKDVEANKLKLTTAETERDNFKTQLEDASKKINDFTSMDIEGIKKAAADYKTQLEQSNTEHLAQINQLKFDHALDGALATAKAKKAKAVRALLDMSTLKLNEADGSIIGLEDQIKKIKETDDYLFEGEGGPEIKTSSTTNKKTSIITDAVVSAARKAAGLPDN